VPPSRASSGQGAEEHEHARPAAEAPTRGPRGAALVRGPGAERLILDDLSTRFTVLDEVEITWTEGDTFAESLSRMYGDSLPPGSDKERHCGTGPFLLVVVEDRAPRYRLRRTNRGFQWLNSRIFDARAAYRSWTGGGYRVHASDSVLEAERNLVLLLGRHAADYARTRPGPLLRGRAGDPLGAAGRWSSQAELVRALEAYGATVSGVAPDGAGLEVVADDAWWVERIAGGSVAGPGLRRVERGRCSRRRACPPGDDGPPRAPAAARREVLTRLLRA
jgi:hypothetical protein